MKVGDYVRTKYGNIGQILEVSKNIVGTTRYLVKWNNCKAYYVSQVKEYKSSPNIIDLIEVGDIITYEYPTGIGMIKYERVSILPELLNILKNGENNNEYKILSIVTKEQFESMEYKVGE